MCKPKLYRGPWPGNVSKTAKYSVRGASGSDRVTIEYDLGSGLRTVLAVAERAADIVKTVSSVKLAITNPKSDRGTFYINEYHHLVVPDNRGHCYFGGRVDSVEFVFEFEGKELSTKPVNAHGEPLIPGDQWVGPRPGIPYVLKAGGSDVYYETCALTDSDPPQVREGVTRKCLLSKAITDGQGVADTISIVLAQRDRKGGRFYVNEHQAIFTPVSGEDGVNYIYCGQLDLTKWFPEPRQDMAE